ncbi:hypothetical protein [Paenibacillus mendelii]|uniref:UDP-N-acetylglucosamine kinase n=1 Tax=Paenibacillus mendelii TaxID=206163 RepID=A0ABV6J761_9BACL|nr:hypothetical protein [Paenibacillus mendelii]MCQ6562067.1 hypothetical protein [Paenibacillus mendelii]
MNTIVVSIAGPSGSGKTTIRIDPEDTKKRKREIEALMDELFE